DRRVRDAGAQEARQGGLCALRVGVPAFPRHRRVHARAEGPAERERMMAPPRRPLRDNPRLILAGMIVLLAALVGIVALANRSAGLSPDFLTEFVLYG